MSDLSFGLHIREAHGCHLFSAQRRSCDAVRYFSAYYIYFIYLYLPAAFALFYRKWWKLQYNQLDWTKICVTTSTQSKLTCTSTTIFHLLLFVAHLVYRRCSVATWPESISQCPATRSTTRSWRNNSNIPNHSVSRPITNKKLKSCTCSQQYEWVYIFAVNCHRFDYCEESLVFLGRRHHHRQNKSVVRTIPVNNTQCNFLSSQWKVRLESRRCAASNIYQRLC